MDPLTIAATAAQGFEVLRCEECARHILEALHEAGHRGDRVELRGSGGAEKALAAGSLLFGPMLNSHTQVGLRYWLRAGILSGVWARLSAR